ncbi:MAG TPA: hypothetical protein VGB59_00800 [Allosphingosinicella sp.]|jgi:hypothetical protein
MKAPFSAILAAALLTACATGSDRRGGDAYTPGKELVGRTVTLETAKGQVSQLHFQDDGEVEAQFGESRVQGNWTATGRLLCFSWSGSSRECWPYSAPFQRGRTVTLTSDRGNVVKVTLR